MSAKQIKSKGLGRGLNAIFDTEDIKVENQSPILKSGNICEVNIEDIIPNKEQPRQAFDEETISELSASIKALGLIQPITLRKRDDGKYTIISGERRYKACLQAGFKSIPAYTVLVDDTAMLEMSLVENIQREDLNPMEIAFTLNRLIEECGVTQEVLAEKIGKKRSTISNYVRLVKQSPYLHIALAEDDISMGHAKALMSIGNEEQLLELLKKVINQQLSVRQTETLVKNILEAEQNSPQNNDCKQTPILESYSRLVKSFETLFTKKVTLKQGSKGDGKIVISFKNENEVKAILNKIESLENL